MHQFDKVRVALWTKHTARNQGIHWSHFLPQTLPAGKAGDWGAQAGPRRLVGESGGKRYPPRGRPGSWEGSRGRSPHSRSQRSDAATRHVEEGAGAGTGAQGSLNATEQVIGLEDEEHLARHVVEELADLGEVVGCVVADLCVLKQQQGDRRGELVWRVGPRVVGVRAACGWGPARKL